MIDLIQKIYSYNVESFSEIQRHTVKLGNLLASLGFIISTLYSLFYLFVLHSTAAAFANECFAVSYLLHFFYLSRNRLISALLAISITFLCQMFFIVVFFASSKSGFQYYYFLAGPTAYYFFRTEPARFRISLTVLAFILFILCIFLGDTYSQLTLSQSYFDLWYFSTTTIVFLLLVFIIHTFQREIALRENKLEHAKDSLSQTNEQLHSEIQERIKTEEKIAESEKRFRKIFDQAAVGVSLTDTATGKLLKVNRKYCDITGYSKEQLYSSSFKQITHPEDLEVDLDNMSRMLSGDIESFSMEKRYIRPDRSIVWANLTVSPMWDEQDQKSQHISIIEDISKRKVLEDKVITLQGIIPICGKCKKIRDDKGYWNQLEAFISQHSDTQFSHGICPECVENLYGQQEWFKKSQGNE